MTTATTTGLSTAPDAPEEALALLARLTELQLTWSFEGTFRSEQTVKRVAACYGLTADVTMLADSAVLTVGERTLSFARSPIVPPLDQVSDLEVLLREIDGGLGAGEALARLEALAARPP